MKQNGSNISFKKNFNKDLTISTSKHRKLRNSIIDQKPSIQKNIFLVINNNNFNIESQLLNVSNQSSFHKFYKMIKGNLSLNSNNMSFGNNQNNCSQTNNSANNLEKTTIVKKPFTNAEDEVLLSLIKIHGPKKWQKIAQMMKNLNFDRNGRQCRDRYYHYLDPNINVDHEWSPDEDSLLLNSVEKFGKKWKLMEKLFKGRTEVSLRNRYNLLLRKKFKEKRTIKKKLPNDDNDFEQNGKELTFNFEMFKEHEDAEFENSLSLESSDSLYNLYY